MAEETKKSGDESSATVTATASTANYVSGDTWSCKACGMNNDIASWTCRACFTSMKKSMQRDKNIQQRNRLRRQRRRDELKAKKSDTKSKGAANKSGDEQKTSDDDKDKDKDKTETQESKEVPLYKVSDNIPKTMKALVKENEFGGFTLKTDEPVPVPEEDELLIRSFAVAICGSDAILYDWTKDAQTIAKLPFIPGHEAAGLIVGVGRNCRFRIGDRVAIENHFYCGECYQCKINRKDICANLQQFGHGKGTKYGGCCEYYTVKERYAYRLKADISWRDAALLEPLGVAHNACEQADLNEKPNGSNKELAKETVLIVGCGAIGCMAVGVAKTMPLTGKVIACDLYDEKLKVAKQMGADETFNVKHLGDKTLKQKIMELTDNVGVGRIIECSGSAKTIEHIFGCLRKGGAITLVGLPKQPITLHNPLQDVIFKSIQIRTVHGRRIFRTWARTERLVADRKINLDPIVSHELPLEDFEKGYKALKSGEALKVVFNLTK